jgi:hypothetical protein
MSYWELHRLSLRSVFLGLQCLPEVETLTAMGFSASSGPQPPWGGLAPGWKVAAAQQGPHQDPRDRTWTKPSLSLGVPSVGFLSSHVLPEFSLHHNPTSPAPSLAQLCRKVQLLSRYIVQLHQRDELETTQCPTNVAQQFSTCCFGLQRDIMF